MEQRDNWMCDAHEETFRVLHQKLDAIIERQIDYVKTSARIEMKQEQIEKIVTNGLSHNLADLSKKLDTFCEDVRERLSNLEDFQWFRLPVTKMRDKLFWYALKIALAGGGIYLILYYAKGVLK
jgi:hypothetical protein